VRVRRVEQRGELGARRCRWLLQNHVLTAFEACPGMAVMQAVWRGDVYCLDGFISGEILDCRVDFRGLPLAVL